MYLKWVNAVRVGSCPRPQGTSDRCFSTNCQQYFMAGLFLIPLFTQFITRYWPCSFLRTRLPSLETNWELQIKSCFPWASSGPAWLPRGQTTSRRLHGFQERVVQAALCSPKYKHCQSFATAHLALNMWSPVAMLHTRSSRACWTWNTSPWWL